VPNPTAIEIKHSLLLIHGTIYGCLPEPHPEMLYVWPGRSNSLVRAEATPWRASVPYTCLAADHDVVGTITHNEPIDVVSWYAGPGEIKITGMEIWEQCMTLFMRHI